MTNPAEMDRADPLSFTRERFKIPDGIIYLDGNSLGALPLATPGALHRAAELEWGADLIASWNNHGWIDWPARIAAKLGPILGAGEDELLIADSTSICLFKLLCAAARSRPKRRTILTERGNFPTDLYVAHAVADLLGLELKALEADALIGAIDEDVSVLTLTHVDYRSARLHDMALVNRLAREHDVLVLWDLSHSAGAVELDLHATRTDLAVGCGYKYLNGGPGAPAFLYIARHLLSSLGNPLQGWMGHAQPFAFSQDYQPAGTIGRFQTGTPPVLALAALEAGLDTFAGIAMHDIARKSRSLSQLFIEEVEARCGSEVRLASPRDPLQRGSHVVFGHHEAHAVVQALIGRGIIGDFRTPNLMRFGFAPLYNTHAQVAAAAQALAHVLATREWDQPRFHVRAKVT